MNVAFATVHPISATRRLNEPVPPVKNDSVDPVDPVSFLEARCTGDDASGSNLIWEKRQSLKVIESRKLGCEASDKHTLLMAEEFRSDQSRVSRSYWTVCGRLPVEIRRSEPKVFPISHNSSHRHNCCGSSVRLFSAFSPSRSTQARLSASRCWSSRPETHCDDIITTTHMSVSRILATRND